LNWPHAKGAENRDAKSAEGRRLRAEGRGQRAKGGEMAFALIEKRI